MNRVLILTVLFGVPTILQAADNYFLCNTSKGTLSLTDIDNQLIYEMSNQHGNKFQYISKASRYSGFLYNHYSRFQTDYFNISFSQDGYKYTVFSNYENGSSMSGVSVVDMKTKKEYVYNCNDYKVDKLADLVKKLQCDTDNTLGCQ
ncbi:hypothetical protein KWH82_23095 [Citrobacter cronae]|nr:hypothetical protein [Citrobacter cronae]